MVDTLQLIRQFLEEHGYDTKITRVSGLFRVFEGKRLLFWNNGRDSISVAICRDYPQSIEIWIGGRHTGRPLRYKYASTIAFRLDLHNPYSLIRLLEIIKDPVEKPGDVVLKCR